MLSSKTLLTASSIPLFSTNTFMSARLSGGHALKCTLARVQSAAVNGDKGWQVTTLKEEYEKRKASLPTGEPLSGRERILRLFERLIPILIPVAGGIWAIVLFADNRTEVAEKQAIEQIAQSRTRLVEAQKPFIDHQFGIYKDLTRLLGDLLVFREEDRPKWDKLYDEYWRVHIGPMHFVENDAVREANLKFGQSLQEYRQVGNTETYQKVRDTSEALITAMKNDLKSSWTTGELGTKK